MTIVENNTHEGNVNLTSALKEEIEYIRTMPDINKEKLGTDFNPLFPESCFIGQMMGQGVMAEAYRQHVGYVPENAERTYRRSATMTPLEVWGAENWPDNKDAVVSVLDYIKNGGTMPDVSMN